MPLTYEERECILDNSTIRAWISKRAYELHQLGGYQHGKAAEDWMVAESELLALASLFENIFRSKAAPRPRARKPKTKPKPKGRQTPSSKGPTTEKEKGELK